MVDLVHEVPDSGPDPLREVAKLVRYHSGKLRQAESVHQRQPDGQDPTTGEDL
ncbi:MAG: hypothetical protein KDB53_03560 [Planctomycetes bacterium]|nr:hypothetical protein [Planctomycetota bacterium]